MAVLHTLRTNKIFKILTFTLIGGGLLLFVLPQGEQLAKFFGAGGDNQSLVGSAYGQDIESNIVDPTGRTINPWNFTQRTDILNNIKSNGGPFFSLNTRLDFRNIIITDFVWDDFITRSYVDNEMDNMGFKFSDVEQIDLYKGTITGIDNLHPLFRDWWTPLGLCNRQAQPLCVDTLSPIELEENIKDWKEDQEFIIESADGILSTTEQAQAFARLSNDELYRKLYVEENSKILKYFSIYENGYFIPESIIDSENLNDNKTASGMYIYIPFRDISNQISFSPSDSQILDYYNINKYKFPNQKKTRELDYYMFTSKKNDDESVDSLYDIAKEFHSSASTVEEYKELSRNYNVKSGSVTLTSIMQNEIISEINNNTSSVRDIVRWAYGVNMEDEIIENLNIGETYHFKMHDIQIIFCLKSINEDNDQSIDQVRIEIIKELTNQARGMEIQKMIDQKTQNNSFANIEEMAESLNSNFANLQLASIENLKFTQNKFQSQNLNDPELIGTFFGISINEFSKPYIGKEGVYILLKTEETVDDSSRSVSIDQTRRNLLSRLFYANSMNFRNQIVSSSKENGSINDRRFFIY